MKRFKTIVCALVAAMLLPLAACAGKQQGQKTQVVTIAEYHASDTSFDILEERMSNGTPLPVELYVQVDRRCADVITDQGEITSYWNAICSVKVLDADPDATLSIDDGGILFEFRWQDGSAYGFSFLTSEYYAVDGGHIRVESPDAVRAIVNGAVDYLEAHQSDAPAPDDGSVIPFDRGFFEWDGDGDGVPETYAVDFHDLGDEAPSYITITQLENPDLGVFLNGAYEIALIRGLEDEDGPFLQIDYYAGDYYVHDAKATRNLRIVDGELVGGD